MSAVPPKLGSRARQHWSGAIHKCIVRNLTRRLEFAKVDPKLSQLDRLHIQWRLGFNLFYSRQYYESIAVLEMVCLNGNSADYVAAKQIARITREASANPDSLIAQLDEDDDEELLHGNYHVHLLAGRCCVKMFLASAAHYHLENAYKHYQNCIESMTVPNSWEQKTTLRLPVVLHELGHLMEHYGAFSSAIDIYTRIMTEFHNYRGYFDVMYRSALVGRHVSELMSKSEDGDQTLVKCIDMLQFLLEALPATIDESHIILLYARTLDKSKDPSIRFRANGVYKNLFDHLKGAKRCNADKFSSYKDWGDIPQNWFLLAEEISASEEPLLAKDAYELFTLRVEAKRQPGKDLAFYIDVQSSMKVAKNYARFQNFVEAVKYADLALQKDHLNKEVRSCLSQWSKIHAVKLGKEEAAINIMHARWKARVWSDGYREKIKTALLQDLEERIDQNRYDREARDELSYFARDKWRARFLFEATCAVRLQRFMRGRFKIWKAQQRLRSRYLARAVEAYRLYSKKPFDYAVREEVKAITRSRHCPRKHIINKIIAAIESQDAAIEIMQRAFASYHNRRIIMDSIMNTKRMKEHKIFSCATVIQCMARKKRSWGILILRRKQRVKQMLATVIVQRFVRWRNSTFQHAVTRVIYRLQARHRHARLTFVHVFAYYMRRYIKRKRESIQMARRDRKKLEQKARYEQFVLLRHSAARVLKRAFLSILSRRSQNEASTRMRCRKMQQFSNQASAILAEVLKDPSATNYQVPGISQSSSQFAKSLQQSIVYCNGSFSSADCMMLSTVLRNAQCRVQKLVLHDISDSLNACFEFDLLPAISKCRSLRSVSLLGGTFSLTFLKGLIKEVQVDNQRIRELIIEGGMSVRMKGRQLVTQSLTSLTGCLLLDYFNYSVSGIAMLSLHDCFIRDADLDLIVHGLRVNSSLQVLTLSKNLITDVGFAHILESYMHNRKTKLATVDLRHNLIECRWRVSSLLDLLNAAATEDDPKLDIHLAANMITRHYPDLDKDIDTSKPVRVFVTLKDPTSDHQGCTPRASKKKTTKRTLLKRDVLFM